MNLYYELIQYPVFSMKEVNAFIQVNGRQEQLWVSFLRRI